MLPIEAQEFGTAGRPRTLDASNDLERATAHARVCSFSSQDSLLIRCAAKLATIGVPHHTFCGGTIREYLKGTHSQNCVPCWDIA